MCSSTFFTGILLKRNSGWFTSSRFIKNFNSTACFRGSTLKDTFQSYADLLISSKSRFISLTTELISSTTVHNDVSSAKTLHNTFHIRSQIINIYKESNRPRLEPCGTPAETSPRENSIQLELSAAFFPEDNFE